MTETTWWSFDGGPGDDVCVVYDGRRYSYRVNDRKWPNARQPGLFDRHRRLESAVAEAGLRRGPPTCGCGGSNRAVRNWLGEMVAEYHDCLLPRARCVICHEPLEGGRCANMLCQHDGLPVPEPEYG